MLQTKEIVINMAWVQMMNLRIIIEIMEVESRIVLSEEIKFILRV
jgi:hypothetical protein